MSKAKQKELSKLFEKINKKYGDGSINLFSSGFKADVDALPTGAPLLDDITGIGGFPVGRIIEVHGENATGKAQPLYSNILTPKGWVRMGDIQIGQEICAPNGTTTTVIGIFPQGEQDIYEITLDDKTTARCTLDHLWETFSGKGDLSEILTVKEMMERGLKKSGGGRRFRLPKISPTKFEKKSLDVDPYLMGLLLGDGSFVQNKVSISSSDEEVLNEVRKICERDYNDLEIVHARNYDYRFRKKKKGSKKNKLHKQLIDYGLEGRYSYEKHIPEDYLYSSVEDRIELLRGLMDSDGTVSGKCAASFSTTSKRLSEDFEFLARSLGFRCTTSSRTTRYMAKTGSYVDGRPSYRSSIIDFHINPFRLKRKAEKVDCSGANYSHRYIESIAKVDRAEVQCIKVGHPDELYITDNFIPTHNTTIAMSAIAACQAQGKVCAVVDVEHAWPRAYAEKLGVDHGKLVFSQPDSAEQAIEIVRMMAESGSIDFITLDSVAALVPNSEVEGDIADANIALRARLMSKACRVLPPILTANNCSILFINQFRDSLAMYGSATTTPGGRALPYAASLRLKIRRKEDIKEGTNVIGHMCVIRVIKNKVADTVTQEAEIPLLYGKGFDPEAQFFQSLQNKGIIERKGSYYYYGEINLGQGEVKAKQFLQDNEELLAEIKGKA